VPNLIRARLQSKSVASPVPATGGMMHSLNTYPVFRMLIFGTLATNSAFWMYQVAVGWLALQMTDSPFFVGLAGFAGGIPVLLFSLPAGVIIDRYDKRSVLRVAQFGVMLVAAIFALLVGTDLIERWSLLLLVFAYGTIMSFIFPARTAIVPSLVQRDDLANAVALNAAGQNATRVVGPSLAGVLIASIGVWETFAVAASLQTLALYATSRLPSIRADAHGRGGMSWTSLTVGLRIVAKDPFLSALITIALAPTIFVMPYINLMPVFARDVLDLGSTGLGLLLAGVGLGTVAGALSVARSPRIRALPGAQVITASAFSLLVLVFSAVSIVPLAFALLFAAGWASASFLAINQTALQLHVDDNVRGRVLSIYLLTWGMLPIGQLAVGALANLIGSSSAMVCSCVVSILCIALIARRFPMLRPHRGTFD
jgi:MFS family permease